MNDIVHWFNQNNGFVLVVLTFVYVAATLVVVRRMTQANRIANKSVETVIALEQERSRPSVFFHLYTVEMGIINVFASVQNLGLRTAYEIKIDIEPTLERYVASQKTVGFVQDPIASLPPQARMDTLIGPTAFLRQKYGSQQFRGTVRYRDQDGTVFSEPFLWELPSSADLTHVSRKSIHDVGESLDKIVESLRRIESGFNVPLFRVIPEETYRDEKRKEYEQLEKLSGRQQNAVNSNDDGEDT